MTYCVMCKYIKESTTDIVEIPVDEMEHGWLCDEHAELYRQHKASRPPGYITPVNVEALHD